MSALLCIPLELKTEAVEPKEAIASDWNVEWGRGEEFVFSWGWGMERVNLGVQGWEWIPMGTRCC